MDLSCHKRRLSDERLWLALKYGRLIALRACSSPSGKKDYDLILQYLERQLDAVDARLALIETNGQGPDVAPEYETQN